MGHSLWGSTDQTGLSGWHAGLVAGLPGLQWGSQGDIPAGWFPASFPALKTHENRWDEWIAKHIECYHVLQICL